jgi:hypothetical protein
MRDNTAMAKIAVWLIWGWSADGVSSGSELLCGVILYVDRDYFSLTCVDIVLVRRIIAQSMAQ